ncbi:PEP-CTERM sorting domain-containing protein [Roseateles toxinivorans]|uniref:Putative secreted protein with PEP-CTERM sorting signal n=1 Tax=Roseateles toxinivorans TaxID=270368 RepID=A0A4R6QGS8_9BURK|nr:PEP-CTERM sorting domain-containing protein [Roseateles toxinivorans]TDP61548.1 putative secreted protein with PEP-CTERM sorting signal [Roseateles toxinivorans]
MNKLLLNAFAAVVLGASAISSNAALVMSDAYIGSGGAGTGQSLAGDRFRSFQPTGSEENYLGIPSLGNASNRVVRQLNWMTDANNPLTSFDFTFQYDQASDKLVSTILGGSLEYSGWSTKLAGLGKTKGAADLNAFQITVKQGDVGSLVYLTDMVLDGVALGSFSGVDGLNKDWLVTGSDMNLTDGFTLTGKLWLQGAFSSSQENSAVNLTAGWDTRGVAPAQVPEPGTLLLAGAAIAGLLGSQLRKRKQ